MADQKQQEQLSAISSQLESKTQSVDVSAVKRQDRNGRSEGKIPSLRGPLPPAPSPKGKGETSVDP